MKDEKNAVFDPSKAAITKIQIIKANSNSAVDDIDRVRSYSTGIKYDLGFNMNKGLIRSEIEIKIQTVSKVDDFEEALSDFYISFLFKIDNLKELVIVEKLKDGKLKYLVDSDLSISIASMTYSTARGILFTRLQGTVFKDFILPVVSSDELIKKDKRIRSQE